MFFVLPTTFNDFEKAIALMMNYALIYHVGINNRIMVTGEHKDGHFRLAEMAFQMNFRQARECAICGNSTCGHLTFTSAI